MDEGEPMRSLIAEFQSRAVGRLRAYVDRLLAEWTPVCISPPEPGVSALWATRPCTTMVEPLTERELEVLRLLRTSLSLPEIAGKLVISANTVRSHAKHIYAKLDVHSRGDALARAQEMGLL
jgi:LuxR family maltose regulon positive regulatory protein